METKEHTYTNVHMKEGHEALKSEEARREQQGKPWRPQSMIEDNPIGLDEEAAEQLIPKLDELQASLWILYHQYHKHHWLVEGPQFMQLHVFLEKHYEEVHQQLDAVAERMTAIGGIPTSDPVNQAEIAFVTHEPEGTYRIRESLEHDRAVERHIAVYLRKAIKLALDVGDFGTKTLLEEILFATEDRAHHLDHFLGEDTLEVGLLHTADDIKE